MSEAISQARGGDFATARRGAIDSYEIDFILRRLESGTPGAAIAKMLGRPLEELRPYLPTPNGAPPEAPKYTGTAHDWRPRSRVTRIRSMPPYAREIAQDIAIHHRVTLENMLGPSPKRIYAYARHEAWTALYATGRYSLPQIGSWFGGRDHSTVMSGIRGHMQRAADLHAAMMAARCRDRS